VPSACCTTAQAAANALAAKKSLPGSRCDRGSDRRQDSLPNVSRHIPRAFSELSGVGRTVRVQAVTPQLVACLQRAWSQSVTASPLRGTLPPPSNVHTQWHAPPSHTKKNRRRSQSHSSRDPGTTTARPKDCQESAQHGPRDQVGVAGDSGLARPAPRGSQHAAAARLRGDARVVNRRPASSTAAKRPAMEAAATPYSSGPLGANAVPATR